MANENNENEFFENPDALAAQFSKSEKFVKKNKTVFLGAIAAVVLVVVGFMFWRKSSAEKEEDAFRAIYRAEYFFGQDSLDLALNGDGVDVMGFKEVASEYAGTKAGNLANYYMGSIELEKGNFENAASYFDSYDNDAFLISARAFALTGDAYMELEKLDEAIKYYQKAVKSMPNEEFTPRYMVKLGLAYELAGQYSEARLTYEQLVKDYPQAVEINDVKRDLAKVSILATKKG